MELFGRSLLYFWNVHFGAPSTVSRINQLSLTTHWVAVSWARNRTVHYHAQFPGLPTLMTVHLWHRFVWNVFGMWSKTNCTVQSVTFWTSKIFGSCSLNGAEITLLEQKNLVLSHVHIVYCCLNLIFGLHSRIFM